jgi:hypothetical protein
MLAERMHIISRGFFFSKGSTHKVRNGRGVENNHYLGRDTTLGCIGNLFLSTSSGVAASFRNGTKI